MTSERSPDGFAQIIEETEESLVLTVNAEAGDSTGEEVKLWIYAETPEGQQSLEMLCRLTLKFKATTKLQMKGYSPFAVY